jgi:hypothetical protein
MHPTFLYMCVSTRGSGRSPDLTRLLTVGTAGEAMRICLSRSKAEVSYALWIEGKGLRAYCQYLMSGVFFLFGYLFLSFVRG